MGACASASDSQEGDDHKGDDSHARHCERCGLWSGRGTVGTSAGANLVMCGVVHTRNGTRGSMRNSHP